jgi:hypothetical protein
MLDHSRSALPGATCAGVATPSWGPAQLRGDHQGAATLARAAFQQRGIGFDAHGARARVGLLQQHLGRAVEAAPVHQRAGLQSDHPQPFGHAPCHFAMQPGGLLGSAEPAGDVVQRVGLHRALGGWLRGGGHGRAVY